MIPGTVLMVAALFVESESVEWSLNIIGLILMIVLPFLFTPLHAEKKVELAGEEKQTNI